MGGAEGAAKAAVESGARRRASMSSPPTRRCSPPTAWRSRELAEKKGVGLKFEAAVAGGIPVIKTLRESLLANRIAASTAS